jgi:CheY-like chemotaxis protein
MAGELILIVEDNEKNRKLVRDLLRFKGYQTVEATTAEEGLAIATTQQPALILMDILLPGMDGITAFKHLRADPKTQRVPVIAVTASVMPADRQKILATGFNAYQTKPINLKEFMEVVRKVLDADQEHSSYRAVP